MEGFRHQYWTKAGFPKTVAIMDKIGGWSGEGNDQGGSVICARLAPCLWNLSKEVDQGGRPTLGQDLTRLLVEDMNTICVWIEDDNVWVSRFKKVLQEDKMLGLPQYVVEVPCVWQSVVLWF